MAKDGEVSEVHNNVRDIFIYVDFIAVGILVTCWGVQNDGQIFLYIFILHITLCCADGIAVARSPSPFAVEPTALLLVLMNKIVLRNRRRVVVSSWWQWQL